MSYNSFPYFVKSAAIGVDIILGYRVRWLSSVICLFVAIHFAPYTSINPQTNTSHTLLVHDIHVVGILMVLL